jgi:hypothetical protein
VLLCAMHAYCKKSKPTNTFAGKVLKGMKLRSRFLWGRRETDGQAHTRSARASAN